MRYLLPLMLIVFGCSSPENNSTNKELPAVSSPENESAPKSTEFEQKDTVITVQITDSVQEKRREERMERLDSLRENRTMLSGVKRLMKRAKEREDYDLETNEVPVEEEVLVSEEEMPSGEEDIRKTKEDIWHELLEFVDAEGKVDYKGFVDRKNDLVEYLKLMNEEGPEPGELYPLSYYLNLYNASTIMLIVENYPVSSIKDIPDAWTKKVVRIKGETYSLNELENDLIRKQFKNPQVHFGLNCAAKSCPMLSNKPFVGNAEDQLSKLTQAFLNNSKYGVSIEGEEVSLSKIFEWYAEDFGGKENLLKWVGSQKNIDLGNKKIGSFIKYDWSLNKI